MAQGEFDLIHKYFCSADVSFDASTQIGVAATDDILVDNGDDAAVIAIKPGEALVACVDTLVAGVHFPKDAPVDSIGHKALAVNISDIAAMGGVSKWATLALTLPEYNHEWLEQFSKGFFALANKHDIRLIGGDTTRGPLTISVQLMGVVKKERQLLRGRANIGDKIFVSGPLGEAGIGLESWQGGIDLGEEAQYFHDRLNYPQPQAKLGEGLLDIANSAIDISDGLASDLSHVLKASGVGAVIYRDKIPCPALSAQFLSCLPKKPISYALYSGDDYHLCFTVSPANIKHLNEIASTIYEIGEIVPGDKLILQDKNGGQETIAANGYNHF